MGIKLSACTIAKNEELNIGKSIDSYKDYVDEIIIVDTGSIDKTAEIAKSKGAKVLDFKWINDFAAAKNFALDNATGDWIVFLDADEWFDGDTAKNIRNAIEAAIKGNYDAAACKLINFYTETEILETMATIRIFKRSDNIRFDRAIHETLFELDKGKALPGLYNENIIINHSGYMKNVAKKKTKRNKKLLDRYFAMGNIAPIDYFYGIRENSKEDPNLSEYFYKLVEKTSNYEDLISTFNISSSLDEFKLKLSNILYTKYSFEYRFKMLKGIQLKHPKDANFYFNEYEMLRKFNLKEAIIALNKAIEVDEKSSEDYISNNSFCLNKSRAETALGIYYLFTNDKLKALDCFTKAIKYEYNNLEAFYGLLYTISNEKNEDKILFINSLYDMNNKEVEKFIIDSLRLSQYKEVFLYYFVDYYNKYEEVDLAYFTSRLYTENYDELVDKYMKAYKESKDPKALILIAAALICGNCKDRYLEVLEIFTSEYINVLNAYFDSDKIESITEFEVEMVISIIKEIMYLVKDETLIKLINISDKIKNKAKFEVINECYEKKAYNIALYWIEKFKSEKIEDNKLLAYLDYVELKIHFSNGNFEKVPELLDKVIYNGLLSEEIIFICDTLEAEDEKLKEYFYLFDKFCFLMQNIALENIEDVQNDTIKFITIDTFKEYIEDRKVCLLEEHLVDFFEFAEKAKKTKAYFLAEEYYKICLKYGYKIDKCYYYLGEVYNELGKPELSYYCYENAFLENLTIAKDLLPEGNKNSKYIFIKKKEENVSKCPICGGESKHIKTFCNLHQDGILYSEPIIVKYAYCENCNHLFAINKIVDDKYIIETDNKIDNYNSIEKYYDILENVCEMTDGTSILDCSRGNEFKTCALNYGFDVCKEINSGKFDIIFASDSLSKTDEIKKVINLYLENLAQNGIIIFEMYDKNNAFSKLAERPLWAKPKVKNIFSKESMEKLFNEFGLQIIQINIDKLNKGKVIVYVSK